MERVLKTHIVNVLNGSTLAVQIRRIPSSGYRVGLWESKTDIFMSDTYASVKAAVARFKHLAARH